MIEQFRAGGRKMGFGPMQLLLLTTQGAKTGRTHVSPLAAFTEDGHVYIVASYGGAPEHPAWFHNLVANPVVEVEHDGETYEAQARVLPDAERDPLFARIVGHAAQFGEYQQKTGRTIPVVELERLEIG
jgi:deazaflavin-dependent oxidoreductase (nitroreductase family)